MDEITLGRILYHKNLGPLVVSENIENLYISCIEIGKIDFVKNNISEDSFYSTALVFPLSIVGVDLFFDDKFSVPSEKIKVKNCYFEELRSIEIDLSKINKENRDEAVYAELIEKQSELQKKIQMIRNSLLLYRNHFLNINDYKELEVAEIC